MSEQCVRGFVERMKSDATFRGAVDAAETPEARLALLQAAGYDCTAAEIAAQAASLHDEHLAGVVGGGILSPPQDSSVQGCGSQCPSAWVS